MAKARFVRPEFSTSQKLSRVSPEIRLTFIGIMVYADDRGLIEYIPKKLTGDIFPYDDITEKQIILHIEELIKEDILIDYEYDGRVYLHVKNWEEKQNISRKSKWSHIPYDVPLESLQRPSGKSLV